MSTFLREIGLIKTKEMRLLEHFIGGEFYDPNGDLIEAKSPITGQVAMMMPDGTEEVVNKAVDAAKEAFKVRTKRL